jgi:hypothetical protein
VREWVGYMGREKEKRKKKEKKRELSVYTFRRCKRNTRDEIYAT